MPIPTAQIALARSRSYALLARLFLAGLTAETLPTVQAIPALVATLPDEPDFDQAAADHQHLFGFNVFPYQSIFLDADGLLGGAMTDAVLNSYRQAGFSAGGSESADHIGRELDFLAFLCGAEADALEDGLPAVAGRLTGLQQDFLNDHLLRWLAPLSLAIRGQGQPFYTAVAALTGDVVDDHRAPASGESQPAYELPTQPLQLDRHETGLREIADYLLTPPYSGIYLSRDDIGRLARQLALPRGFGERRQMLLNLLNAAATYEVIEELLVLLAEVVEGWAAAYGQIAFAGPWLARAAQTAGLLREMDSLLEQTG